MSLWQWLLALAMVFTCFLLVVVILLQRGRGGGLSGAFGGAGGTAAFGAKTGDVFTWITVVVAGVFILLSIAATFVFDQSPALDAPAVAAAPGNEGSTGATGAAPSVPTVNVTGVNAEGIKIEPVENPFVRPGAQLGEPKPTDPNAAPSAAPAAGGEQPKPAEATPPGGEKPAEEPKQPESGSQDKPNP